MDKDLAVIHKLAFSNNLIAAGMGDYRKIWIRDNVYVALALMEADKNHEAAIMLAELCSILEKYNSVLTNKNFPKTDSEILHPRFTADGAVVPGHWGNKQHDAIGALLFAVGKLNILDSSHVTNSMKIICNELIGYLESCRYWEDADNGMWEEEETLHSSSLAACIKGIELVGDFCNYNKTSHELAKANLSNLLPKESKNHSVDLATLSVVWPYGYKRQDVLTEIEAKLLRERGVIRYLGDIYESKGHSEPQWVMGIPWLGIAHFELGNIDKSKYYLQQTDELYTSGGLPEAYEANNVDGVHTPLAWSHAMAIVLRSKLAKI